MKQFTLGSSSIGDLEKKYVMEVLNNNFISPGPVVDHVEKETARLHGMKHGLALNSGQSAIHVAIQAIIETRFASKGRRRNQKPLVAVPACTYISTLAAAILAKLVTLRCSTYVKSMMCGLSKTHVNQRLLPVWVEDISLRLRSLVIT